MMRSTLWCVKCSLVVAIKKIKNRRAEDVQRGDLCLVVVVKKNY